MYIGPPSLKGKIKKIISTQEMKPTPSGANTLGMLISPEDNLFLRISLEGDKPLRDNLIAYELSETFRQSGLDRSFVTMDALLRVPYQNGVHDIAVMPMATGRSLRSMYQAGELSVKDLFFHYQCVADQLKEFYEATNYLLFDRNTGNVFWDGKQHQQIDFGKGTLVPAKPSKLIGAKKRHYLEHLSFTKEEIQLLKEWARNGNEIPNHFKPRLKEVIYKFLDDFVPYYVGKTILFDRRDNTPKLLKVVQKKAKRFLKDQPKERRFIHVNLCLMMGRLQKLIHRV